MIDPTLRDTLDFLRCHPGYYLAREIAHGAGHPEAAVCEVLGELVDSGVAETREYVPPVVKDSQSRVVVGTATLSGKQWRLAE